MSRLVLRVPFAILNIVACGALNATELTLAESNVEERNIGGQVVRSERDEQEALFNYYFSEQGYSYETKLADLKTEASVPSWRVPYSAAIHPESSGGLSSVRGVSTRGANVRTVGLFGRGNASNRSASGSSALSTYDRAFNGGQNQANSYEIRRIMGTDQALFPLLRMRRNSESWEGYCSGFTASTIKHPEPVNAVDAGDVGGAAGIVLQPAEIKALLTGIYNRTSDDSFLFLAPPSTRDGGPNMGTFHLALANYVGHARCPVGIDRTKGRTSWNNPVYAYKVTSIGDPVTKDGVQYQDVETTVTYSFYGQDSTHQTDLDTGDRVGNTRQSMTLRYTLALDDEGRIIGGRAKNESGHFLWIPLYPVQGTEDGSAPGNPYIDIRKVIALARASALPEVQKKYDEVTIGPAIDPKLEEAEAESN
ncbi:MAG: hypothetical protein H8E66_20510 [Planctomycetes bacterium]|nr:hypothetical protein [Planctomycetota bacterium]